MTSEKFFDAEGRGVRRSDEEGMIYNCLSEQDRGVVLSFCWWYNCKECDHRCTYAKQKDERAKMCALGQDGHK
uniref:Uncharacterized protein n=1 Tax=viral metagenome TaxID=1070528 RepID=A0A6M3IZY8_9ZZZZ